MSIIEKAADRIASGESTSRLRHVPSPQSSADTPLRVLDALGRRADKPASLPPRRVQVQQIDPARLQRAGMVSPTGGRSVIAEEFRTIKRPLISTALRKGDGTVGHNNLIMVTSALPDEGKTFCAINLAISIAMEMDHTVLLVDADVARPSIPEVLGLQAEAGLMDLLRDERQDMADVMIKTNIDTLSILPAGKTQQNATELLASQSMTMLLNEIASRYPDRIVIFDSPPLLPSSEARVLAEQMGQIVMVVESEKTTHKALKDALRRIESCRNINLIYNKGRAFTESTSYGYYG